MESASDSRVAGAPTSSGDAGGSDAGGVDYESDDNPAGLRPPTTSALTPPGADVDDPQVDAIAGAPVSGGVGNGDASGGSGDMSVPITGASGTGGNEDDSDYAGTDVDTTYDIVSSSDEDGDSAARVRARLTKEGKITGGEFNFQLQYRSQWPVNANAALQRNPNSTTSGP